jgi:hypothetical protein
MKPTVGFPTTEWESSKPAALFYCMWATEPNTNVVTYYVLFYSNLNNGIFYATDFHIGIQCLYWCGTQVNTYYMGSQYIYLPPTAYYALFHFSKYTYFRSPYTHPPTLVTTFTKQTHRVESKDANHSKVSLHGQAT